MPQLFFRSLLEHFRDAGGERFFWIGVASSVGTPFCRLGTCPTLPFAAVERSLSDRLLSTTDLMSSLVQSFTLHSPSPNTP